MILLNAASALLLLSLAGGLSSEVGREVQAQARRVFEAIAVVQAAPPQPGLPLRRVEASEDEVNAYIACRIATEGSKTLREVRLKLLGENRIEGMIRVDLKGQKLPPLLRPEMNFFFAGRLQSGGGRVRLETESLYLERQRIQVMVIDLVILIGSKLEDAEPWSIQDWFELPYGIKALEAGPGKLSAFY